MTPTTDNPTVNGIPVLADAINTYNGNPLTPAAEAQEVKLVTGADGVANSFDLTSLATQTTLAAVLAKLSSDPATQTTLAAVLAKLSSDPATQTTLASVLAKLSSDPATQTTLAALVTKLSDGSALIKKTPLTSATPARVASSATVVTLAASNNNRRALKVFNESTAVLFVKDGSAASITDYSVQIPAGGYYEWPLPIYTGVVTGLWASANGAAQVTEGT